MRGSACGKAAALAVRSGGKAALLAVRSGDNAAALLHRAGGMAVVLAFTLRGSEAALFPRQWQRRVGVHVPRTTLNPTLKNAQSRRQRRRACSQKRRRSRRDCSEKRRGALPAPGEDCIEPVSVVGITSQSQVDRSRV